MNGPVQFEERPELPWETGFASERAASAFERAAKTEREASQENERAARAEQQASEENARAAKALEAAEVARKNAEGFQLQIAQAEDHAAEANRTAESERLARLKLEATLKHRRLAAEKKTELTGLLKPFAPTGIVIEVPGNLDAETADLASDVNDAIVAAGIPMSDTARSIVMGQLWPIYPLDSIPNDKRKLR